LSVVLNTKPYYGIGLLDSFYFDNIFAETDEFGEYYLAGNSMTLYICPPEDFADGCLEISLLSSNFISGNNLSYVSFDGINFTLGKGNGLVLTGNNLTVENCELSKINGDAIYVNGSDITVQNNVIYQIGANAVAAYGGVVETLAPANILVCNNLIYKWAQVRRTYKCAVRLEGCGITASHNEMYDAPHEAIEYIGPNNLIEYNIIHDVCLETHDCGAIYAMRSFDQYGTVLRYNIIYDIGGKFGSGMGIYWDDGLSGQTMYGNIIANTPYSCSMNIGGGRDNVIENNLFISWAYDEYSIFFDNRAREYADEIGGGQEKQTVEMAERLAELQKQQEWLDAFPGYEDIIPYTYNYAGDRDDLYLSCNAAHNTVRNNIACQVRAVASSKYYFAEWISEEDLQGTYENNMVIHDPDHTFIPGYENNDFTIAEDSEVYSNGFVRIPVEEIGRVTND
ncbi:MAG: right-handed parallel beta-helix repeat-containing protein, partial [Clostridia bacterium]|nr:right-handed parallel beta-helix repeat-containing protein [Clostridia bacterium]